MGKLSDMVNEIEEGRIDKCNNAWMHEIILELLLEVAKEVNSQRGSDKRPKNHEAELGHLCRIRVTCEQEIKELLEENKKLKDLIERVIYAEDSAAFYDGKNIIDNILYAKLVDAVNK